MVLAIPESLALRLPQPDVGEGSRVAFPDAAGALKRTPRILCTLVDCNVHVESALQVDNFLSA